MHIPVIGICTCTIRFLAPEHVHLVVEIKIQAHLRSQDIENVSFLAAILKNPRWPPFTLGKMDIWFFLLGIVFLTSPTPSSPKILKSNNDKSNSNDNNIDQIHK